MHGSQDNQPFRDAGILKSFYEQWLVDPRKNMLGRWQLED
jgi:hypothetical protein